ncbi:MAG: GNAT family N-acetyltransferase [Chloroflexota bacterium]|nr:GNAT family N-acetyltransferase [Anaerolineae bacterium]
MTALEQPTLNVSLPVVIRIATEEDLPRLEWYGQYIHYRNLFRRAYHDQQLGTRLMLVADCNGFPVGHVFILFIDDEQGRKQAYLYSLRVMEMFHSQGIGTHLLMEAEAHVLAKGYHRMTIAAAKTNHVARRLYERLGYEVFMDDRGEWSYTDHLGKVIEVKEPCWLLQKTISMR